MTRPMPRTLERRLRSIVQTVVEIRRRYPIGQDLGYAPGSGGPQQRISISGHSDPTEGIIADKRRAKIRDELQELRRLVNDADKLLADAEKIARRVAPEYRARDVVGLPDQPPTVTPAELEEYRAAQARREAREEA